MPGPDNIDLSGLDPSQYREMPVIQWRDTTGAVLGSNDPSVPSGGSSGGDATVVTLPTADESNYGLDPNAFRVRNYDQNRAEMAAGARDWQTRQVNPVLEQLLMARAQGQGGPSAAELQMNRGLEAALRNSRAQALGAANPALAQRLQANAASQMNMQNIQNTGVLRAQEQAQATDQMSQYAMQQQQLRNNMIQYYTSAGLSLDDAQSRADRELAMARNASFMQVLGYKYGQNAQDVQNAFTASQARNAAIASGFSTFGSAVLNNWDKFGFGSGGSSDGGSDGSAGGGG